MPIAVLLDTNAVLAHGLAAAPLPGPIFEIVQAASAVGGTHVSPVTAWEIAMISRGKPKPDTLAVRADPRRWWREYLATSRVRTTAFTPEIAFDAYLMPPWNHGDPADRLLVATARALGCPIVTSDREIFAYGRLGHVQVIPF